MRRLPAIFFTISIAVFLGGRFSYAQAGGIAKPPAGIAAGLWEGSITLKRIAQSGEAGSESPGALSSGLRLKLLDQGKGALMDIAEQSMFGYPLDDVRWNAGSIRFILDALGPGEELACEGVFSASTGSSGTGGLIIGTAKARSWKGTFLLRRGSADQAPNETLLSIPTAKTFFREPSCSLAALNRERPSSSCSQARELPTGMETITMSQANRTPYPCSPGPSMKRA